MSNGELPRCSTYALGLGVKRPTKNVTASRNDGQGCDIRDRRWSKCGGKSDVLSPFYSAVQTQNTGTYDDLACGFTDSTSGDNDDEFSSNHEGRRDGSGALLVASRDFKGELNDVTLCAKLLFRACVPANMRRQLSRDERFGRAQVGGQQSCAQAPASRPRKAVGLQAVSRRNTFFLYLPL